jgi:hypothetical protein
MTEHAKISQTRTYVAMCNKSNFDGYYFRKFTLPTLEEFTESEKGRFCLLADEMEAFLHNIKSHYRNDSEFAHWYFLNRLDFVACTNDCFPFEHYQDIKEATT